MQVLNPEFESRITGAFGAAGATWLRQLPRLLEDAAERWSLKLLAPFQPLSYNYVAPARGTDGTSLVLKAGVPNRELSTEVAALRLFAGQGAVRLIEADTGAGLMLLERLVPGRPLLHLDDDDHATAIFVQVIRRLQRPAPPDHDFPGVSDWADGSARLRTGFGGLTGPIPEATVNRAESLFAELLGSMSNTVVLHGDLHHWNILSAEREPWLAVDPKGVIGEPEYETGAWLRNPFPPILAWSELSRSLSRRLDRLVAELGYDRERLIGWAYCQSVLAGVWSFEEGLAEWRDWLNLADHFTAPL